MGLLSALMLAVIIYGFSRYPYGVQEDGHGGFVDKVGNLRSKEDYDGLKRWEGLYFGSWVIFALSMAWLGLLEKASRQTNKQSDKGEPLNRE